MIYLFFIYTEQFTYLYQVFQWFYKLRIGF